MKPRNLARRAAISARLNGPAALQAIQAAYHIAPEQRTAEQAAIVALIERARTRRRTEALREIHLCPP